MAPLGPREQAAIRHLWKEYVTAFDEKSAPFIARLYAPDGDLIGVDGKLVAGPAAIGEYYIELFSKIPMATISDAKIEPARTIGGSAALVNGTWRVRGVEPNPVNVVGTFVVRRERGRWSYVAVRFIRPFP